MALAGFTVLKCTGASAGAETVLTTNQFALLNEDSNSLDAAGHPIAVPSVPAQSPNYSYETWIRFKLTTLPNSYVQNLRIYGAYTQPDNPTNLLSIMMGKTSTAATPGYTGVIVPSSFTGTLNDMVVSGEYTGTDYVDYEFLVDSNAGATDTFKWRKVGGTYSSAQNMSTSWITIGTEGLKVKWLAVDGHGASDYWNVAVNNVVAQKAQHLHYTDSTTNYLQLDVVPGDGKLDAINELSYYVVFQLQVDYGASQGSTGTIAFTLSYEEA